MELEYVTTSAGTRDSDGIDCACPDPGVPHSDSHHPWRMVGSAANNARVFWFWERKVDHGHG